MHFENQLAIKICHGQFLHTTGSCYSIKIFYYAIFLLHLSSHPIKVMNLFFFFFEFDCLFNISLIWAYRLASIGGTSLNWKRPITSSNSSPTAANPSTIIKKFQSLIVFAIVAFVQFWRRFEHNGVSFQRIWF